MPAAMAAEQATERRQQPFFLAERIGTVLQRAVQREEAVAQRRIADAVAGEIGNLRQTETVGHRIERGFREIERAVAPARTGTHLASMGLGWIDQDRKSTRLNSSH